MQNSPVHNQLNPYNYQKRLQRGSGVPLQEGDGVPFNILDRALKPGKNFTWVSKEIEDKYRYL